MVVPYLFVEVEVWWWLSSVQCNVKALRGFRFPMTNWTTTSSSTAFSLMASSGGGNSKYATRQWSTTESRC